MQLIDTHCHLTDPSLYRQLPEIIARARAAGVFQMITVATLCAELPAAGALGIPRGISISITPT